MKWVILFLLILTGCTPYFWTGNCGEDFVAQYDHNVENADTSLCNYHAFSSRGYVLFDGPVGCHSEKRDLWLDPDHCFIDIADVHQNISFCKNVSRSSVSGGGQGRYYVPNLCYDKIENLSGNPSRCNALVSSKDRYNFSYYDCLTFIATKTHNFTACSKIPYQDGSFGDCITPLAIIDGNISYCYQYVILDSFRYAALGPEWCIRDYADAYGLRWEDCLAMENKDLQQICLKTLIPRSNNESICDQYLPSCIDINECKRDIQNNYLGTVRVQDEHDCKRATELLMPKLYKPVLATTMNGTNATFFYLGKSYQIEILELRDWRNTRGVLDSVTAKVNGEYIRQFPLTHYYALSDGTNIIFTFINQKNKTVSFILGSEG